MTVGKVLLMKLIVADVAAMVSFYERAFGFVERNRIEMPGMVEVLLGLPDDPFTLVLYHHTDGRTLAPGERHGPLGLSTRDIDAAYAAAIAAGATAVQAPQSIPGIKFAFVDDPEGHPLEFIQYVRQDAAEGAAR